MKASGLEEGLKEAVEGNAGLKKEKISQNTICLLLLPNHRLGARHIFYPSLRSSTSYKLFLSFNSSQVVNVTMALISI